MTLSPVIILFDLLIKEIVGLFILSFPSPAPYGYGAGEWLNQHPVQAQREEGLDSSTQECQPGFLSMCQEGQGILLSCEGGCPLQLVPPRVKGHGI